MLFEPGHATADGVALGLLDDDEDREELAEAEGLLEIPEDTADADDALLELDTEADDVDEEDPEEISFAPHMPPEGTTAPRTLLR